MKRIAGMILALALFVAPLVAAAPVGASGTANDQGSYTPPTTGGSIGTITAGHVYSADLSYSKSTTHWAGIFGTITQEVKLSDGTNDFYTWSGTLDAQVVYLSNKSDIFGSGSFIGDLTTQDINDLGIWNEATTSFADNLENTTADDAISGGTKCTFVTVSVSGTNFKYVDTTDGTNPYWTTCLFGWDGNDSNSIDSASDAIVVAGKVDTAGHTAYDGTTTANYQVMVPTNTTGIAYYVWVE